ncbi:hypothetical protein [Mesorhizobium sp. B3-1-9]|uniref:hypothetical protein n=1 Tax=Mesorhizobium sp. B3-1-9 TaxID=2589892 RepID=UPI0015E46F88|nr:hypothetical protein [Mesorhizobium sp. B3-1-9]
MTIVVELLTKVDETMRAVKRHLAEVDAEQITRAHTPACGSTIDRQRRDGPDHTGVP